MMLFLEPVPPGAVAAATPFWVPVYISPYSTLPPIATGLLKMMFWPMLKAEAAPEPWIPTDGVWIGGV